MAKFNSEQEVLDHVVPLLIKQGKRSHNGRVYMYNGPDGTHCAIGWCGDFGTSDNNVYYLKEIRGKYFSEIFDDSISIDFLRELQKAHDAVPIENFVTDFLHQIEWISKHYVLVYRKEWR